MNSQRQDYQGTNQDLMQCSLVSMTALIQNACTDSAPQIYEIMIPVLQKLEQSVQLPVGEAAHI